MLLGHSELRVTMDFYAHLQTQTASKAARHMDAVLQVSHYLPTRGTIDVRILLWFWSRSRR